MAVGRSRKFCAGNPAKKLGVLPLKTSIDFFTLLCYNLIVLKGKDRKRRKKKRGCNVNYINTYKAIRNESGRIAFDCPEDLTVSVLVSDTNERNTAYTVIHEKVFYFVAAKDEKEAVQKYIDYCCGMVEICEFDEYEDAYVFSYEGWASDSYDEIEKIRDEYEVVEEW